MDYLQRAREVIQLEANGLCKVRDALSDSFAAAIDTMIDCLRSGGKIVVTGIGKNLHIAQKISGTLASTGATSVVMNPTQAMHGDLGILNEHDVLLALSYSGESDELVALLPLVRRAGLKVISLTSSEASTLGSASDITINTAVDREACPFNMAPTASTTATLAIGDALAMVLLEARGFEREDYAKLHPGGAIGRALLVRVADIMRTGDRAASVSIGATVKETVLAMTAARSGSAGVVDHDGRLLGIFTDGDLRRHIMDGKALLDRPIKEVMTLDPVTIEADRLAMQALHVFEENMVDDLLVLDECGHLVGAIDSQDLPKVKMV